MTIAVSVAEDDSGVTYPVEHVCLNGSVVVHVLQSQSFADLQWVVEKPIAHEVARQARVSAESVFDAVVGIVG